jgi:hypothetical protein
MNNLRAKFEEEIQHRANCISEYPDTECSCDKQERIDSLVQAVREQNDYVIGETRSPQGFANEDYKLMVIGANRAIVYQRQRSEESLGIRKDGE